MITLKMVVLIHYLTAALLSWALGLSEKAATKIVTDVVEVVDLEEPVLLGDPLKVATSLLVLSEGSFESAWAPWVLDGSCNDDAWRAAHAEFLKKTGDCDSGHAYGGWQIHPFVNIRRFPRGPAYDAEEKRLGALILKEPKRGIKEALRITRESITWEHRLCHYTGERFPRCPKADKRWDRAHDYLREHPFEVPVE